MKFLKGLGKFFAVILSIFVCVVSLLMIFYISVSRFISTNNLKKVLNTSNVLKMEIDGVSLEYEIIGIFEEFDISREDAKAVVSSQEFTNLMDDYFAKAIDYYILDKDFPTFDNNMLNNLLDLVMSKNTKLNSSQKEEIKKELMKEMDEIEESLPDKEEVMSDSFLKEITGIYSSISIFYFIGAIIILMFIIFVFTYSLYKPFKYIGISLIVSGILFMIPYIIFGYLTKLINADMFVTSAIKNLAYQFFITSLMVLSVGIVFVVFYTLINSYINKNMNKEVE